MMSSPAFRYQHLLQRPDGSGLYDEIVRGDWLASEAPNIKLVGQELHLQNHATVCKLRFTGQAWWGSCTYGRTHVPVTRPCCEARALEKWYCQGLIPNPRAMILDQDLLTCGRHIFAQGTEQRAVYDRACTNWRLTVQEHAQFSLSEDAQNLEQWYLLCTACLICPDDSLIVDQWQPRIAQAQQALQYELPAWFHRLCSSKESLVQNLQRAG